VKALHEKGLVEPIRARGTFVTDGTSYSMRQSLDRMLKIGQPEGSAYLAEVRESWSRRLRRWPQLASDDEDLASMREQIA